VPNTTPPSFSSVTTSSSSATRHQIQSSTTRKQPQFRPVQTTAKPHHPPTHLNEIPGAESTSFGSKTGATRIASARLNMGGIIALGVFGGFVFLAAVITIIVIIIRR